jgi:predicted RNA polymerase sigma factor
VNEDVVRVLAPQVLGILVRRGNDFAAAEDAVQDALLEAHRSWDDAPPDDPKGWLLTVADRKLIDARRSEAARRRREDALSHEPRARTFRAGRRHALTDNPVAALSRAIAVGEVDGPLAGLSAVEELATRLGNHHRLDAVRAHLHERAGHPGIAAEHYTRAAARARNTAERDYLTKQAARLHHR